MTSPIDIERVRAAVRGARPGTILIVAPDVYDGISTGEVLDQDVAGLIARMGVEIKRSEHLGPGKIAVMAAAQIELPRDWAADFLAKGGPGSYTVPMTRTEHDVKAEPPPPPEPERHRQREPRQRIVDT